MPKIKKERVVKAFRHDPLEKQISDSKITGRLKPVKVVKLTTSSSADDPDLMHDDVDTQLFMYECSCSRDGVRSDKMSKSILDVARTLQNDIDASENKHSARASSSMLSSTKGGNIGMSRGKNSRDDREHQHRMAEEDDEDEDELDEVDNYDEEIEEVDIDDADEKLLAMFMPASQATQRSLAYVIMEKNPRKGTFGSCNRRFRLHDSSLRRVGQVLAKWTSGKIPKAFKIIPSLKNWEQIILLTNPSNWSPNAMYVATKLFASNLNPKMAQRFYYSILLPAVRDDIGRNKRLNFHYYMSLKKSIYKPAAFFKGLLLPLAQDGCSSREAVILSSVMSKVSIPVQHASVALLKLTEMKYNGLQSLFIKTLVNKKYSLPVSVINTLIEHFCSFQNEKRVLPVLWHQTLLVFAQRYKTSLSAEQKDQLKTLLRLQQHHIITAEIRRELFGVVRGGKTNEDDLEMKLQ